MNASHPSLSLVELRRQLEEILAMVSEDFRPALRADPQHFSADHGSTKELVEQELSPAVIESDELFDRALAVITEFGRTSPAILQMWLAIDYACATALINQFKARGLISSKGRVSHKAYELRRSRGQEHPA